VIRHRSGGVSRRTAVLVVATVLVAATIAPKQARSTETPLRSFTLAAAGDVLVHERVADLAAANAAAPGEWDFWPMLEPIEPWVSSADFAICHLESTLSSTNTGLSYWPRFVAPNAVADALQRAGWDACSVASNHALDAGFPGVSQTLFELDRRGIGHSGTARSPAERLPRLYRVNGVTIAHLSFSQHFNGLAPPQDKSWAANRIDVPTILEDAAWARRQGADFVVLSVHWGVEYVAQPIGYQTRTAEAIMADPAVDLILGHHPHVVEPIQQVNGRYVAYSMGNHLSNQHSDWGEPYFATNEGQLLFFDVAEQTSGGFAVTGVTVVPTWVRLDDLHVFAAQDAIARSTDVAPKVRSGLERTMTRTLGLGATNVTLAPYPWPLGRPYGRDDRGPIRLPAEPQSDTIRAL